MTHKQDVVKKGVVCNSSDKEALDNQTREPRGILLWTFNTFIN